MTKIIDELTMEFRKKNVFIDVLFEDDEKIIINISNYFRNICFDEDLEILKKFENKEEIRNNIIYLCHHSFELYLRGD